MGGGIEAGTIARAMKKKGTIAPRNLGFAEKKKERMSGAQGKIHPCGTPRKNLLTKKANFSGKGKETSGAGGNVG